jgi:hypothetical protein
MTKQEFIEKVAARVGQPLNQLAIEAIEATLEVISEQEEATELPSNAEWPPLEFERQNVTLEEYVAFSDEEKSEYIKQARRSNADWLEQRFQQLNAAWLMVVAGKVIAHGTSLDSFPTQQELIDICRHTGQYPFIFVHPRVLAVEESSTPWHPTKMVGDQYPALRATLSGSNSSLSIEADLDTGAWELFADLTLLVRAGVIHVLPSDPRIPSSYLGRGFDFTPYSLLVEITDESGMSRQALKTAICVHN